MTPTTMGLPAVKNDGRFQKGHNLSVGEKGRPRNNFLTQGLVALLHELDTTTNKERMWKLSQKLYDLAVGYTIKKKIKNPDGEVGDDVRVGHDLEHRQT
jgi:hypothetical protein